MGARPAKDLRPPAGAESFRSFVEIFGRLSRERFLGMFSMPFLMTQANTDPLTWASARITPVTRKQGRITILAESADEKSGFVGDEHVIVGRETRCDVVVARMGVSKRHAQLTRRDRSWWVTDLDSSNGTTLDGQALTPGRPTKIARTPARLCFGSDGTFMFLTPETLFEFLAQIRHVHGIEEPVAAPVSRSSPADTRLDELDPYAEEKFSRAIKLARSSDVQPIKPAARDATPLPTGTTKLDPERGGDEQRFLDLLSAIDTVGDLIGRIEVKLESGPEVLELFRDGSQAQLRHARERLVALRPRIASVRLTPSVGDRVPYDIYVRRA